MLSSKLLSLLSLSFLPIALSAPTLFPRQDSCADTCGSTCYTSSEVSDALSAGYSLYTSGSTEGSDDYPHQYHDYEGFTFPVAGLYYEFPILSSGEVYSGGSPGPDRVVFDENGDLAGLITHTGASGNNFDQCTASGS